MVEKQDEGLDKKAEEIKVPERVSGWNIDVDKRYMNIVLDLDTPLVALGYLSECTFQMQQHLALNRKMAEDKKKMEELDIDVSKFKKPGFFNKIKNVLR